jgi:hypothetical protein
MKILKLIVLSAVIVMVTVGASNGAPASILTMQPAEPGPINPTNGELVTSYSSGIYFTWDDTVGDLTTPGSGYYDIEISTDATFLNSAAIVAGSTVGHTKSCGRNKPDFYTNPSKYQSATTYYFRIQAYDLSCHVGTNDFTTGGSGWAEYSFKTSIVAPTLIAPANNSTLVNNLNNDQPHLFQWSSVAGATGYVLEVSTSTAFSSLYLDVSLPYTENYYSPAQDLPSDTTFYWQVETLNGTYGPSAWSNPTSTWSFKTGLAPSPAPVPISNPQVGSGVYVTGKVTNDWTPGLRWKEIALPGGTTFGTYEVEASTDSTFYDSTAMCFNVKSPTIAYLQNQTQNNNPNLNYAQLDTQDALATASPGANCPTVTIGGVVNFAPTTTYYWRVRAETVGSGPTYYWSDWSRAFEFKTSYPKVDSSTFTVTKNTTQNTITFNWTGVGGYSYAIQICSTPDFAEGSCAIANSNVDESYTWWIKKPIPSGALFYWHVRANGPYGPSLWSYSATVTTP